MKRELPSQRAQLTKPGTLQRFVMAQIGEQFSPGDRIPHSGIYDVVHDQHHRPNHQVMCIEGRAFPACQACGGQVRFALAIKVRPIDEDSDFHLNKAEETRSKPSA